MVIPKSLNFNPVIVVSGVFKKSADNLTNDMMDEM
jgi:hypothetical protein